MKRFLPALLILFLIGCAKTGTPLSSNPNPSLMELTSPTFKNGANIPPIHTCDGQDRSPELNWTDPPENIQSFTLIMSDPDAPMGTWDHWVLFNIPADTLHIPEGSSVGISGNNSWSNLGYGGPCPPNGNHRYFFKLYALDTILDLPQGARKTDILSAMKEHILEETELMGRYERS